MRPHKRVRTEGSNSTCQSRNTRLVDQDFADFFHVPETFDRRLANWLGDEAKSFPRLRQSLNTIVRWPFKTTRPLRCQATARDKTRRSISLPLRTRSSAESR